MNMHEELFVKNFIVPQKRDRYLSMLASRKQRKKILENFYHLNDLDERYMTLVPENEQWAINIYDLLKAKKSPDICYCISTDDEIDGKEIDLLKVLESKVGECYDGTIISCIAGELAYYEGESAGVRYILEKK
jgi:hypothetical protein